MGYRRRRSKSSSIVGDAVYIANRLPWWGAVLFGVISFIALYWLLPAWLMAHLEDSPKTVFRPVIEMLYGRRIHWLQWIAIAVALACAFLAAWKYYMATRVGRQAEQDTNWLSRLVARFLD